MFHGVWPARSPTDAVTEFFARSAIEDHVFIYTRPAATSAILKGIEALNRLVVIDPGAAEQHTSRATKMVEHLVAYRLDDGDYTGDYGLLVGNRKSVNLSGWLTTLLAREMRAAAFEVSNFQ